MLERANNIIVASRNRLAGATVQPVRSQQTKSQQRPLRDGSQKPKLKTRNAPLYYASVFKSRGSIVKPTDIPSETSCTAANPLPDLSAKKDDSRDLTPDCSSIKISPMGKDTSAPAAEKRPELNVESIIEALDISELGPTLRDNKVRLEDLLLLTKDDMKELGIPIYARNRLLAFQRFFRSHRDAPVTHCLLYDILRSLYNPAFISMLEENDPEPSPGAEQKISTIVRAEEPSPNEDRSLARLASELTADPIHRRNQSSSMILPSKSQTPSFSARPDLHFGEIATTDRQQMQTQTERKTRKAVLQEISLENQSPELREEVRDFQQEYRKIVGQPFENENAKTEKEAETGNGWEGRSLAEKRMRGKKKPGAAENGSSSNRRDESKENVDASGRSSGVGKVSDRHREQLDRYRAELQSILGE